MPPHSDLDKPLRFAPTHPDIQAAFGAEYDLVKLGKQTYKGAAAKFVPKIDALLKKAKEGRHGCCPGRASDVECLRRTDRRDRPGCWSRKGGSA